MKFTLLLSSIAIIGSVLAHTVEVCYSIQNQDVTFYAGTYHHDQTVIGGVIISGQRYDFTEWVADNNEHPVTSENVTCSACATYTSGGIHHWQKVVVQNVAAGIATIDTTKDTAVEYPWCNTFPDLNIVIPDSDEDGVIDTLDNCLEVFNPGQEDVDADGLGDACDSCFGDNDSGDSDSDGFCDDVDVCYFVDGQVVSSENLYSGTYPHFDAWCQASCNQPGAQFCPPNFCKCRNEFDGGDSGAVNGESEIIDDQLTCASDAYIANPGTTSTDEWCNVNCNYTPAFCPETLCMCA